MSKQLRMDNGDPRDAGDNCPDCGHAVLADWQFCPECGTQL